MTDVFLSLWKLFALPKQWQLRAMRVMQDQFLVGVTGVFFNDKKEILLVRHTYRDSKQWSLPGGYIKAKEHPKEGLEREVEEETGLVVSADHRYRIRTDRDSARLDIVYVGSFIGGAFRSSKEVVEAKFFAYDALPHIRHDQLVLIEKIIQRTTKS